MALVVEVVEQAGEAPQLLVLAEAARVRAHRGLDGQDVLAQGSRLGPLAEEGPGLGARKRLRHGWYPSPAPGRARRRPSRPSWRSSSSKAACRCPAPSCPPATRTRALPLLARQPAHRRAGRAAQRAADPRRRGDARAARRPRGRRSSGATTTPSRSAPTGSRTTDVDRAWPSASAPRSWSPARCWPASARRCCRRPAAT